MAFDHHVGLAGDHAIQPVAFDFGGPQYRAAAVGNTDRDDPGIAEGERRLVRKRHRQGAQAELGGLPGMPAPIGLGIVLRMRVLDRDAAAGIGRRHERQRGSRRRRDAAIDRNAETRIQIEIITARRLVGMHHRAAAWQAPGGADRHRAIDATRTRGHGHHQATLFRIEGIRHLGQHAMWLAGARHQRQAGIFTARHIGKAAVHAAVATGRTQIGNATPAVPDRPSAQFRGDRIHRICKGRRLHRTQAVTAQTGGEQVITFAMGGGDHVIGGRRHPTSRTGTGCQRQRGAAQGEAQPARMSMGHVHGPRIRPRALASIVLSYQAARAAN